MGEMEIPLCSHRQPLLAGYSKHIILCRADGARDYRYKVVGYRDSMVRSLPQRRHSVHGVSTGVWYLVTVLVGCMLAIFTRRGTQHG